jgi:PmbA protein
MSTRKDGLTALADRLVKLGQKKGADGIEVTIDEGSQFRASVRDGELETLTESGSKQLSLRVFVDGKVATASSSDFAADTLDRLVGNAVARAKLAGKDSAAGLPELEKVTVKAQELGIFDLDIVTLTPDEKIAYATKAEAIGLAQEKVAKSLGATFVSSVGATTLANSNGFRGAFSSTLAYATVGFQAGDGDNLFQDAWFEGGRSRTALPEPEVLAKTAAHRVTRLIGARKVETQEVPVVLEPPVTASLLLGLLAEATSGRAVSRKQSFLVGKLGTKIASDLVTVVDDGLLVGGFGTAPFDSEGVPHRRLPVVEAGVLKGYLLDTYYGRKLGMPSTGNAGGPTNLFWAAGESQPEKIVASVDRGLLLTGTIGFGTDPTTGDISIGAFGLWIEDGAPAFPVAEITISGNLADLLAGVEMVGNDLRFHGSTNGPTVKVAQMSVGGTSRAG